MIKFFRTFLLISTVFIVAGCAEKESPVAAAKSETPPPLSAYLTIFTEEYPPLNYLNEGQITGQATAVVRALAEAVGEAPEFKLVPWEQGLSATMKGPNTALYSTVMTEERKDEFRWVGPIGMLNTNLYALSDASVKVNTLEDARHVDGIATVTDYYSEELLKKKGFSNLISHDSELAAIKSLLNGEVKLLVASNTTIPDLLKKAGVGEDRIASVFTLSTDLTYIAFSPDVEQERVARWQAALNEMKTDGRFHALYSQWLPNGTAPGILQLVTEDYPPLTYRENGEISGFVTDVVIEITKRLGVKEPIRLTTWENAYNMARIQPNVVLFSAERTPEREDLFQWVGPVGSNSAIFYASTATPELTLDTLKDAQQVDAIATTTNWFTEQYLKESGFTNLISSPEPVDAVKMLMQGDASLTILTDSTAREIVEEAGYTMADLRPLLPAMTTDYYIALSRDTPVETVRQWQLSLDTLKADGTIEGISKRYFPNDQPGMATDSE